MKRSASAATGTTTLLPPPPAPTSRDANPWPISSAPKGAPRAGSGPAAAHPRRPHGEAKGAAEPRDARDRWLPATMMFFVAGAGLKLAIEALDSGDLESAVGALAFLAMAAVIFWRRLKKKA